MSKEGGFANPMPAGLVALGMVCFLFYAVMTGKVGAGSAPLMGMWMIGGFVVQVIVGVIELKEGNLSGGNVFTWFSGFFMLATGLEFITKFLAAQYGWQLDARIDGWGWAALALSLILWTPVYFRSPLYMLIAVLCFDVALPLLALMDLGIISKAAAAPVIGWLALVAGCGGLLLAAAIVVNTTFGRSIIPCPGPIIKVPASH
ncbi:MAG: hypothetical protein HPY50_06180 [Firmicutes bacterium]|nr:hypothetical protein [Bacillota bacterium]